MRADRTIAATALSRAREISDAGWPDMAIFPQLLAIDYVEPRVDSHALNSVRGGWDPAASRPLVFGWNAIAEIDATIDQFGGREHSFSVFDQLFIRGEQGRNGLPILDLHFHPLVENRDLAHLLGVVLTLK